MPLLSAALVLLALFQNQTAPAQPAASRISGRVVEEGSNRPLATARVTLMSAGRPSTPGPPPQASTDRDGRFTFDLVAPGQYWLDVQRGGYVSISPNPSKRETHDVVAGQDIAWPDVVLQKGGVIAGRIFDEAGEPLSDVRVTALKPLERPAGVPESARALAPPRVPVGQGVQTNDLGDFRLFGLPPGDYLVMAGLAQRPTAGTGTTVAATYFPGTMDVSSAQLIAVVAGQEVTGIAFRMTTAPAFSVSGTVVDETGAAVSGAMVMMMPGAPAAIAFGPPGQTRSDDQGRFVIGGVVSGTYTLTAVIPMTVGGQGAQGTGGFVSFSSADRPAATPGRQSVAVRDANVTGVQLVVQRPR
jgi:hypothetical protein